MEEEGSYGRKRERNTWKGRRGREVNVGICLKRGGGKCIEGITTNGRYSLRSSMGSHVEGGKRDSI